MSFLIHANIQIKRFLPKFIGKKSLFFIKNNLNIQYLLESATPK